MKSNTLCLLNSERRLPYGRWKPGSNQGHALAVPMDFGPADPPHDIRPIEQNKSFRYDILSFADMKYVHRSWSDMMQPGMHEHIFHST